MRPLPTPAQAGTYYGALSLSGTSAKEVNLTHLPSGSSQAGTGGRASGGASQAPGGREDKLGQGSFPEKPSACPHQTAGPTRARRGSPPWPAPYPQQQEQCPPRTPADSRKHMQKPEMEAMTRTHTRALNPATEEKDRV